MEESRRALSPASPEAEILQTLSAESISAIDPNSIERDCSMICFCRTLLRASRYNLHWFAFKPLVNKYLFVIMHDIFINILTI